MSPRTDLDARLADCAFIYKVSEKYDVAGVICLVVVYDICIGPTVMRILLYCYEASDVTS
jgi:hypothetical protein